MAEGKWLSVKDLGHLGLISAVFRELGLVEKIDEMLPKESPNMHISHGEAVLAMVLQALGYSCQRMYLSPRYFSGVAVENLFGRDLSPGWMNARVLGRTLDAIFKFGATSFLANLCMRVVSNHKLLKKFVYMDTTSLSVTGRKYKNNGNFRLTHGYSKDHRGDLKQLVFLLATTEEGLPVFAKAEDGNASDGEVFREALSEIQYRMKSELDGKFFVLDSSLYSRKFLKSSEVSGYWISRVPESVKDCRIYLEQNPKDLFWNQLDEDYSYRVIRGVRYGRKAQRWILVDHRPSRYKELATFKAKIEKSKKALIKAQRRLGRLVFKERADCQEVIKDLRKIHRYFVITPTLMGQYRKSRGSKRKVLTGYKIHISFRKNGPRIRKMERRKGKFILATNCLDKKKASAAEVIEAYRGRNRSIEGCFRFLKDRRKCLNQIYLKKESLIEAMLMVMSLLIFVNNFAQNRLRKVLETKGQSIPNQLGVRTRKPSFSWVAELMRSVHKVAGYVNKEYYSELTGISRVQRQIIRAFGTHAEEIYGFP